MKFLLYLYNLINNNCIKINIIKFIINYNHYYNINDYNV